MTPSAATQDLAWISVTHDLVYGFKVCHWAFPVLCLLSYADTGRAQ
jgi:hypothetical protein